MHKAQEGVHQRRTVYVDSCAGRLWLSRPFENEAPLADA